MTARRITYSLEGISSSLHHIEVKNSVDKFLEAFHHIIKVTMLVNYHHQLLQCPKGSTVSLLTRRWTFGWRWVFQNLQNLFPLLWLLSRKAAVLLTLITRDVDHLHTVSGRNFSVMGQLTVASLQINQQVTGYKITFLKKHL